MNHKNNCDGITTKGKPPDKNATTSPCVRYASPHNILSAFRHAMQMVSTISTIYFEHLIARHPNKSINVFVLDNFHFTFVSLQLKSAMNIINSFQRVAVASTTKLFLLAYIRICDVVAA